MKPSIEIHRQTRCQTTLWIELWIGRSSLPVLVRNISTSGIFLRTSPAVTGDGFLSMRIFLPGEKPFFAMGKVTRKHSTMSNLNAAGVGISFTDLHGKRREIVERYINRELNSFLVSQNPRASSTNSLPAC